MFLLFFNKQIILVPPLLYSDYAKDMEQCTFIPLHNLERMKLGLRHSIVQYNASRLLWSSLIMFIINWQSRHSRGAAIPRWLGGSADGCVCSSLVWHWTFLKGGCTCPEASWLSGFLWLWRQWENAPWVLWWST